MSDRGLALRVGVPFALAFAISELLRVVNAVTAPALVADLGLDAAGLGILTGSYFIGFAVAQLPCGVLVDRHGPRRVVGILLVLGALAVAGFGLAPGLASLAAARFATGIGMSVCLMAGFKAFALWLPARSLPLANAMLLAFGQVGSLLGTTPAERLVEIAGWRPSFLGLGLATLAVAAIVFWRVPASAARGVPIAPMLRELGGILASRAFWRTAPLCATTTATCLATPALWAGGWLRDVASLDAATAGWHLGAIAVAMAAGYVGLGWLGVRPERLGLDLRRLTVIACAGFLLVQAAIIAFGVLAPLALWVAFGALGTSGVYGYALLTRRFGVALAGRALTGANLGVTLSAFAIQAGCGWIIGLWPATGATHPEAAYQVAFSVVLAVQAITFAWFVRGPADD
jgi:predicted MFS family arabinose efflux permease